MNRQTFSEVLVVMLSALVMLMYYMIENPVENNNPKCADFKGLSYDDGEVHIDIKSNLLKIKCEGEFYVPSM